MSTTSRHDGLSADDRSKIRGAILSSREMLEAEFERQLERYGIYDDDRISLSKLGHLSLQDRETRRAIDAALERELEATEDYERAYRNYIREATKEYLNRYVGLKTLEARDLITETLTTRAEYGNRSYLHYTVDEIAGELTDAPDDGLGVALDLAYQEIGAEIRVLFDDTDYTAIEPEFTVRRDVFEELDELDDDAWAADEAIGWVYQYFGEKEREAIDERISEENYKVQDTDVATKTQLFTPRYIVEWMVDNSLGRLWLEMHGEETSIDDEDNCFYLAPLEESLIDRDVTDVREITVLDPACGSGHMLLYAFDVLYEMYLEQGDVPESRIPSEILKNNLYGIDIDPGAVGIAALSLYTKAKAREPAVEIEQINVISADAVLINGARKQDVLDRVDSDLERRVLEQVWRSFENIREWGSLVRIEERIEEIIEEEREAIEAKGQARFTGGGEMTTQSSFISEGGDEISWERLKAGLLERVRELAAEALEEDDTVQEMFAGEVEKSVELLDYFVGNYDVVVSNPPYLGSGKMGSDLKQYVRDNHIGSRDLYSAFIERCNEFTNGKSYKSIVTPHSFMFIYSFRKLRKKILSDTTLIETIHSTTMKIGSEDTVMQVTRNSVPAERTASRFTRLVEESNKIKSLTNTIEESRNNEISTNSYIVDQNAFEAIGRSPFIYWFGQEVLQLFTEYPKTDQIAEVKVGLQTGNDDRFIRKGWEIPSHWIGEKYNHYQKSGDSQVYYMFPEDFVLWENNGRKIKEHTGSYVRNEDYYFKSGITFRGFGKYATARLKSDDTMFYHKSHFVFPERISDVSMLGICCSSLSRFIMNGINPSLNFEVGDIKQLPIKTTIPKLESSSLVSEGVETRKSISSRQESSFDYDSALLNKLVSECVTNLIYTDEVDVSHIYVIHGLVDEVVFDEYGISHESKEWIYENVPENLVSYPHITNVGDLNAADYDFRTEVETKQLSDNEYDYLVSQIDERAGDDLREISEALEVSPYTVAMVRHEHDLYTRDEKREAAGRLLSYYLGCIMGRWDLDGLVPDEDGIVVFDESFEDNIGALVRECIELTYGEDELYERESEIEDMLNKSYTDWLRETFFRYHHCKEYRRRGQRIPIYWQLESDDGAFSCFLYYHAMDADTLPKLRGQYVDATIDSLRNRVRSLESQLESAGDDRARELRTELEELQEQLDDVEDFGERLDALIDEGFEPDFEAGIWENIQKVDEYDLLQTELDKL